MALSDNHHYSILFELIKAGLWESEVRLSLFGDADFSKIYQMAEEQSVVGLVTAGLEHVVDVIIQKEDILTFIGGTLQIEQRNQEMNVFLGKLTEEMREKGIQSVLIKGQGVAQCYKRPLWRSSGDIDLLLNEEDYEKSKIMLKDAVSNGGERIFDKHVGYWLGQWEVELHGALSCGLSFKMERALDKYHKDIVDNGSVRIWNNGGVIILLPQVDLDIFVLFTHIIKHFYKGGVGVRQICDLCMLLSRFKESIDVPDLMNRLQETGLGTEWKVFMAYMVEYLGLPAENAPLYEAKNKWKKKAAKVQKYILRVGNFGHNRNGIHSKYRLLELMMGWRRRVRDFAQHWSIFPMDTMSYFWYIFSGKVVGRFK